MASKQLLNKLLHHNLSSGRIIGFGVAALFGLTIIMAAIQFYVDSRSLFDDREGFLNTDYLVVNKRVTSTGAFGADRQGFTPEEVADIERQPWVRGVAPFTAAHYRVRASIATGMRGLSTDLFFEAIPDSLSDYKGADWYFDTERPMVPMVISKDYLALYNFGFAPSAGMPKLTEGITSDIPLQLTLTAEDGSKTLTLPARIVGFSNRLNTILVPDAFMQWSNRQLGSGKEVLPSRLVIDVSKPGDAAINRYLADHDMERAGDGRNSQGAFLVRVLASIAGVIGLVIMILAVAILVLSISLLLEKNRHLIHRLLNLGYDVGVISALYNRIVILTSTGALVLAVGIVLLLRGAYLPSLSALGAAGSPWVPIIVGCALTVVTILLNLTLIRRKVRSAWR